MAFRKVGNFNDLSPKVFPKLPPRGTIVTYRFLQTFDDPFAETDEPIYKAVVQIPSLSICFDPEKNDWVEVGLVNGVELDGTPTSSRIRRVWHRVQENAGTLTLTIGKSEDDELYQYLEVASFNLSNPNRDENVQPMLEKVDYEAEAREARNEIKAKLEAVKKASSIESKDLPRYASILGYDINDTEEELRFNIENFAIEDPFDFLDRMDDTSFEIDSYISLALDKKIVFISHDDNRLKWSDTKGEIVKTPDTEMESVISAYTNYVMNSKIGKDIHEELVRMVNNEQPSKKPAPKK
jgi:hypothetical protein